MQFEWELVRAHLCAGEIRLWVKESHHFFISVILGANSVFLGASCSGGSVFCDCGVKPALYFVGERL
jgi:hypothetical protein